MDAKERIERIEWKDGRRERDVKIDKRWKKKNVNKKLFMDWKGTQYRRRNENKEKEERKEM